MKERPILMNATSINAILAGRQTQDRRPIKPVPHSQGILSSATLWLDGWWRINFAKPYPIGMGGLPEAGWRGACKHGNPGDHLWVRETFALESSFNLETYPPPFDDGRPVRWVKDAEYGDYWEQPHYRATDPFPELCYPGEEHPTVKWCPSIHMPKWATRIWLEIVDIRVERVQDITEEGAQAEGAEWLPVHPGNSTNYIRSFADLWDSIYAKQGLGWHVNPWVFVIAFERIAKS